MFMKRIINLFFGFLFLVFGNINAQKITVNIVTPSSHADIHVFDPAVSFDSPKFISIINLNKSGAGNYSTNLSNPRYVGLNFILAGSIYPKYMLYVKNTGRSTSIKEIEAEL